MKKLSQEEITDKLHQDHFTQGPGLERLSDPVIDTPMLDAVLSAPEMAQVKAGVTHEHALRRRGKPEEIAAGCNVLLHAMLERAGVV